MHLLCVGFFGEAVVGWGTGLRGTEFSKIIILKRFICIFLILIFFRLDTFASLFSRLESRLLFSDKGSLPTFFAQSLVGQLTVTDQIPKASQSLSTPRE